MWRGAVLAHEGAGTIETLLAARFLQGLGAAAPRVVATAMVRDLYSGRAMARVTSIIMTLFVLVPAVAPSVGAGIIWLAGWRAIFLAFVAFGVICGLWLMLRQPESLPPERRRPLLCARLIASAVAQIVTNPAVMVYVVALTFAFAPLFAWLSNLPMIFDDVYDRAATFPFWFAATALVAGTASVANAKLVMRLGYGTDRDTGLFHGRRAMSVLFLGLIALVPARTVGFWAVLRFHVQQRSFSIGLTFGNLNALALQPLGAYGGDRGSSVVMALSTIGSALIADADFAGL
jgi:MFS transporter, DHA1 family, multidrug resistance protein